jgi:two-component system, cell cycle sensor histidine kinase and response regulator CckA
MGTYVLYQNRCSCQTGSLSADHLAVTTMLQKPARFAQDETFDRLARLAAKAVQSSAAFVTLADCDEDEIVFAGITGIPEIPAGERMPLSKTICRHIVSSGVSLVVADTQTHPIARDEATLHALGIGAYLGVPLTTAEGEVIGVLCTVDRHAREWSPAQVEITEGLAAAVMTELGLRSAVERAHEAAAEREAMLDSSLDCIILMDQEGFIREWNPAAEHTFGWTREEAVGQLLANLIVPEDLRQRHQEGLARAASTGESRIMGQRLRLPALRKDGSTFMSELTITKLERGGRTFFTGTLRDLTEIIQAEEQKAAAEMRYRSLIENIPLVTYMNSVETPVTSLYTSPQIEPLLGYTQEEWEANPDLAHDRVHPDDRERMQKLAREARDRGISTQTEFRFIARDGRIVWVHDQTSPVRDEKGTIVSHQGFLLDITEQKQLEEQLRQSQKMEAVGQLAGGIAHDFNNMLTAITGYAELLAYSFDEGDPRADDVEQVRKAAAHAAVLTRQLLAFSRKQVLLPQRLDVNEVVRGLESMLARTLGAEVELRTSLAKTLASVESDPDQLAQVVLNIALNGRDAMPAGGCLTITTSDVEREGGPFVCVEVTDTGTGMDEEVRSRVFEPFFTTKDTGKGTGLGLATAYGFVSQSDGRIEIESALGQGSTFRVLLPAAA